ncbi:putative outer membrane protein Tom13 [Massarina eburnea CBS 473.64]|uniref:Putative outer membrane protein Tom13 n=1 Tax=Massarina eburnea CBS 473.64 TaxID=1395130 RepID=A0A6A6SG95_9PLEO|nr:putative outer membrane protein Tom13 [Massarina eburnea CBS 473.64]
MASPTPPQDLTNSGVTIPSDSEPYSRHAGSASPRASSPSPTPSSPMILYTPPTLLGLVRGAAINLVLPFVNGLMLGFGELVANEVAFRLGWSGTKIFPTHRSSTRRVGPGVEMRADPVERRRRSGQEMDALTSME